MKIQGDEISGYESSMGRKFRHENTIYVNEIYEYSIDPSWTALAKEGLFWADSAPFVDKGCLVVINGN